VARGHFRTEPRRPSSHEPTKNPAYRAGEVWSLRRCQGCLSPPTGPPLAGLVNLYKVRNGTYKGSKRHAFQLSHLRQLRQAARRAGGARSPRGCCISTATGGKRTGEFRCGGKRPSSAKQKDRALGTDQRRKSFSSQTHRGVQHVPDLCQPRGSVRPRGGVPDSLDRVALKVAVARCYLARADRALSVGNSFASRSVD
jgi:hypothetical protein